MTIIPLNAFESNYIWTISSEKKTIVVDPGDYQVVQSFLDRHSYQLEAILLTHHHHDHSGGVLQLLEQYPECPVFVSPESKISIPLANRKVALEGEPFYLLNHQLTINAIKTPGHTLDHIVFFIEAQESETPLLFCGDTLFSAGCGRIFEGTPKQMFDSLETLKLLPDNTQIYCAHEYTLANLKWALAVEPSNPQIKNYYDELLSRPNPICTIPSTLALELQINPFLRTTQLLNSSLNSCTNTTTEEQALALFTKLREWKNNF